jgi:hypothetical protein
MPSRTRAAAQHKARSPAPNKLQPLPPLKAQSPVQSTAQPPAQPTAQPQWDEQIIRRTLDNLAAEADPTEKLDEVLRTLAEVREASGARIATANELELEALQTGLLLNLIDVREARYKPSKKPSKTTDRIWKAVEKIQEKWGKEFHAVLRENGVYLPTRLSRDSAVELSQVAKIFTMNAFCAAIRPSLDRERQKGKAQETTGQAGKRVVQTQDIREAKSVLKKGPPSPLSKSDVQTNSTTSALLRSSKSRSQDLEVEQPRCYSPSSSPTNHRQSSISPARYDDSATSTQFSRHHNVGASPVWKSDGHEGLTPTSDFSVPGLNTPSQTTKAGVKRKLSCSSLGEMLRKTRRSASPATTELDLRNFLLDGANDKGDHSTDIMVQDLSPGTRLQGCTVSKLVREFVPQSLVKVLELNEASKTRAAVSMCIANGLQPGASLVGTVCIKEHWQGILFDSALNTLTLIDSSVGYVDSTEWIDQFSLGIVDTDLPAPVRSDSRTPQQPNKWDCGVYLVVTLLRAFASKNTPPSLPNASPEHISGPFYRGIFVDLLNAGNDAHALSHALVPPNEDCRNKSVSIATRLKSLEAERTNLNECDTSRQSTLQLFVELSSAHEKASDRIQADFEQHNALLDALAKSKSTFQHYGQRKIANGKKVFADFEDMATATKRKIQQSESETKAAMETTRNMIVRLQSLGEILSQRQATLTNTIRAQKDEARQFRKKREEELRDHENKAKALRKEMADLDDALLSVE